MIPYRSLTQNLHTWKKNGESPLSPLRRNKSVWSNKYTGSGRENTLVYPSPELIDRPVISVLSAFEESSAACISDMLRQVSNGQYLDAIRMAEKFILHVEVLFGAIDDLEHHFAGNGLKGMRPPPPGAGSPEGSNLIYYSQACPTSGRQECCVGKPSICSLFCHTLRRQAREGWG